MGLEVVANVPDVIKKTLKQKLVEERDVADGLTTIFGMDNNRLTYGPSDNEVTASLPINKGAGVWDIHGCIQLSSDIVLMYLSKYAQMYKRCTVGNRSRELPRSIKDKLILDNYPVQHIRGR